MANYLSEIYTELVVLFFIHAFSNLNDIILHSILYLDVDIRDTNSFPALLLRPGL